MRAGEEMNLRAVRSGFKVGRQNIANFPNEILSMTMFGGIAAEK